MNAASQWSTIGWMVLCGALMGLVFDFYRVIARRFHIPRWMLPAFDVVYWAAATLGVFNVLLDHNHGEVRLYVFLGLGIGVTGYFGLLGPHVVKAADRIVSLVIGLASWLWKAFRLVIAAPILFLVRILAKLLDIVFVIIAAILLYVGKLLLIPLKPLWNWLWDKLLPVRKRVMAWIGGLKRLKNRIKAAWETFWKKS